MNRDHFEELPPEEWQCPRCAQVNDGEYCTWCGGWKDELFKHIRKGEE